ncbi:uncharacterized protein LOC118440254 [Vespa mandarinia]|uniref:uncharacterized protein LOC118440254 n=1 Tax=Vespa mandarinia TaxID=7446 RepID=UPI001615DB3F|nr:uncharacterized protein LOC118440254 [Vespa mandarinia]
MDKVAINEKENVGKRAKVVRHCGFSSSSSSSSSSYNNNNKPANIESIPVELILQILSYLSQKDLSNMGRVSKYFEGIMQDPVVWRTYEVTNCNENTSKIIGKLRNMPFLKELTINHRKDSDKILRQISLTNKNLEKLYVYNCTGSTSKFYLRSHYLTRILEKCRRLNTIEILGSPFRGRKFYKLLGDVGLRCLKCASLPTRHSQFITFIQNAQQIYDNRLNTYINMCFLPWHKHAQLHYSINRKAAFRTIRIRYSSKYAISIDITENGKRNVHLISMINKATG